MPCRRPCRPPLGCCGEGSDGGLHAAEMVVLQLQCNGQMLRAQVGVWGMLLLADKGVV